MRPEMVRQGLTPVEPRDHPSPIEFEMAYQARVAIDRIRFAIKHTEQFARQTDRSREVGLQLLDALVVLCYKMIEVPYSTVLWR